MAQSTAMTGNGGGLADALRRARTAEAAHYDAVHALNDAKSLRLQLLKDDLDAIVAATPESRGAIELALVPGELPRLWIDLITSVIMEPDPKTYRLVRDGQGGRETIFETTGRAEMLEQVKLQMAHGIIAKTRRAAASGPAGGNPPQYSAASLILAWLSGFTLGALILLGSIKYLNMLNV